MIDCADSTTLRVHLDHPDPDVDAHVDSCETCAGLITAVAADAGYTRQALALLDGDATLPGAGDVEAALEAMLDASRATVAPLRPPGHRRGSTLRRLALASAAAVVVVVLGVTPTGRSALAQVLDAFRGERLQAVTVDIADLAATFDGEGARALGALGSIDTSGLTEPTPVADVAEAEATAGIAAPNLEPGWDRLIAMAPGTVRLTLVAREGNGVPAALDGASLVVEVPGAIGAIYGQDGNSEGPPEAVVGRSGPLVVNSEGAPLEDIRAFVLSREELPSDLRRQLAAIDDWRSTIPVPVPLDGPGWRELDLDGRPAIAFGDDSGLGAVVVRQDPDGVTVVAGVVGITRALELAEAA